MERPKNARERNGRNTGHCVPTFSNKKKGTGEKRLHRKQQRKESGREQRTRGPVDQLSLLLLSSSHVPVAAAAFLVCVCPLVCSVLCYVCTSLLPPSLEDEMKGGGARDKEEEEAGRSLSGTVGIRCRREKGEGGLSSELAAS